MILRKLVRWGGFVLGLLLVAGGQYTLANGDRVADVVAAYVPGLGATVAYFLPPVFPHGIAMGLGMFVFGCALIAWALGLPEPSVQPTLRRRGDRLFYITIALALAAAGMTRSFPGRTAVVLWLATMLVGVVPMRSIDRERDTPLGNPFADGRELGLLMLLVVGSLILVCHDLTHWRWAGTPDEAHFFAAAKEMAQGRSQLFALSEEGVFGFQPVMSTVYQAAFMKLFGVGIFAWRLSSAVAYAAAIPFWYLFAREMWNRRVAWAAAIFYASAQLAMGFAHYGYNNVQSYPCFTTALGVLAWSLRRRSVTGYYAAGCIAGLGFYTYYTARLAPVLMILLLATNGPRPRWDRERLRALALGFGCVALPLFMHPVDMITRMVRLTHFAVAEPAAANVPQQVPAWLSVEEQTRVLGHFVLSVLYAPWFKCPSHFQWSPVVDPISATLATIGLCLAVGGMGSQAWARFLLPGYLLSAFVVGAVSTHECPPLTRLLMLTPLTALFAAVALDQLQRRTAVLFHVPDRPARLTVLAAALIATSAVWNIAALHYNVYTRNHGYGDGTVSELVRLVQPLPADCHVVYVQREDTFMYDVPFILQEYNRGAYATYVRRVDDSVLQLVRTLTPPFLVAYDLTKPDEIHLLESALTQRFPHSRWRDSAAGERWNIRYFYVSGDQVRADDS